MKNVIKKPNIFKTMLAWLTYDNKQQKTKKRFTKLPVDDEIERIKRGKFS